VAFTRPAGEEPAPGLVDQPVLAKDLQQPLGQQGVTILAALAIANPKNHAPGIDVLDPQPAGLGDPQTRRIHGHQQHAVLEVRNGRQDGGDLVDAEGERKLAVVPGERDVFDLPFLPQRTP